MIKNFSKTDIEEIKSRDFLYNKNHFHDNDSISTKLVLGKEEVCFLTIITPVYDHPIEFIKRAINSALQQPCKFTFKLLVIDDYPTKDQTETEKYLRTINDPRVLYYKNETNLGVFANWNRAITLAKSEWVAFLHSDDFLKNNYLNNMYDILMEHPEIDQLACNYRLLDFSQSDHAISVEEEMKGVPGERVLHRVYDFEYYFAMPTSVKGSFYRKSALIELGGFRSQGDGMGLDDYYLMLRFAHYFNTFLLEDVLYLDSWGYNDSLNIKHWYPQIIADYYMRGYFAERCNSFVRTVFRNKAKDTLKIEAKAYSNGTSWVGKKVPIDMDELMEICQFKDMNVNVIHKKFTSGLVKIIFKFWSVKRETFKVFIKSNG